MQISNQKPIKVAQLLYTMAYGGIETILINWLRTAKEHGLEMILVIFRVPGELEQPFVREAEKAGLTVHYIPWSHGKPVFRAARELQHILRVHGTDVLHTHNTYAEIVGLITAKRMGIKVVSSQYVWDKKEEVGLKRYLLLKLSTMLLPFFDLLTAQCEQTLRDSADWGLNPDRLKLLHCGYEVPEQIDLSSEERSRRREERGAAQADIVICNVARLYPEKGHERLLRLWPRIKAECPEAKLWIYGVGPLEEELMKVYHDLQLEDSVRFLGFTSDLMYELALCDIQIHPSFCEGIPLAICAGMAAGLPIVSTAVGGIPEVIQSGQSGILVDVNDEEGLVRNTVHLTKDENERRKLGNEARRFIEEEYSLPAAMRVLRATYEDLLSPVSRAATARGECSTC